MCYGGRVAGVRDLQIDRGDRAGQPGARDAGATGERAEALPVKPLDRGHAAERLLLLEQLDLYVYVAAAALFLALNFLSALPRATIVLIVVAIGVASFVLSKRKQRN